MSGVRTCGERVGNDYPCPGHVRIRKTYYVAIVFSAKIKLLAF